MQKPLLVSLRHRVNRSSLSHRGFGLLLEGLGYRAIKLQSTLRYELSSSARTAIVAELFIRVGISVNAQTHLVRVSH